MEVGFRTLIVELPAPFDQETIERLIGRGEADGGGLTAGSSHRSAGRAHCGLQWSYDARGRPE
jgi:hypothetical protein